MSFFRVRVDFNRKHISTLEKSQKLHEKSQKYFEKLKKKLETFLKLKLFAFIR